MSSSSRIVNFVSFATPFFCGISVALAAPCDMRELGFSVANAVGKVKVGSDVELVIREAQKQNSGPFDGPIAVMMGGKEKCAITGGIFSNVYASESNRYLLTQEYSGSSGSARVFDIQSCKQMGKEESYSGNATFSANQVISPPYCEPLTANGKTGSCSSGHVFDISGNECELKLNGVASQALTKKTIGLELPLKGVFTVREMKSTNARIIETKAK